MKTSPLVFALVALFCPSSCSEGGTVHSTSPDAGDASADLGGHAAAGTSPTGGAPGVSTGGTPAGGHSGGGMGDAGGNAGTTTGGSTSMGGTGIAGSPGGAAAVAGMAGQAGLGGSAGSVPVGLRTGSLRASPPASSGIPHTTLELQPSIQGQDGLLLAQIVLSSSATSNAEASGFKLVAAATSPTLVLHIFWKVAAGPAGQPTTEPATLTVTNSLDAYQTLLLLAVHGYDPVSPIGGSTTAGGDTTALRTPGLSVARPGSLGIYWKASFGAGTITTPNDWTILTRRQDGTNDVLWRALGVGPTNDVTGEQFESSPWVSALVVIQPP